MPSNSNSHLPLLALRNASLAVPEGFLWRELNLEVNPGDFLAVLGPNGAGKTSLLWAILGLRKLAGGSITLWGRSRRRGSSDLGYMPQSETLSQLSPLRGLDRVLLGAKTWGGLLPPLPGQKARALELMEQTGCRDLAYRNLSELSGGQRQRLRIAQALMGSPRLLLCDEPLVGLDPASQEDICELLVRLTQSLGLAVIMVSHDINPLIGRTKAVLCIHAGQHSLGSWEQILDSQTLTRVYGRPIRVVWAGDRPVIMGMRGEI